VNEKKMEEHEESDMMSKPNPLEKYFKPDDVENIGFKSEDVDKEIQKLRENFAADFGVEKVYPLNTNGLGASNRQPIEAASPSSGEVDPFVPTDSGRRWNFFLEKPKLPESGLKSRAYLLTEEICKNHLSSLKWSDWMSCLHWRVGMPRWLTAATVTLGIIFALWLCLVIPSNAPKQKLAKKMTKAEKAKLAEIMSMGGTHVGVVTVKTSGGLSTEPLHHKLEKIDLPPSYDSLKVSIPDDVPIIGGGEKVKGDEPITEGEK